MQQIILLFVSDWLLNCHCEPREFFVFFSRRNRVQCSHSLLSKLITQWGRWKHLQCSFLGKTFEERFSPIALKFHKSTELLKGSLISWRFWIIWGLLSISLLISYVDLCDLEQYILMWSVSFTFIFTKTKMQTDPKLCHWMTIDRRLVWAQTALGNWSAIPVIEHKQNIYVKPLTIRWNKGTWKVITSFKYFYLV